MRARSKTNTGSAQLLHEATLAPATQDASHGTTHSLNQPDTPQREEWRGKHTTFIKVTKYKNIHILFDANHPASGTCHTHTWRHAQQRDAWRQSSAVLRACEERKRVSRWLTVELRWGNHARAVFEWHDEQCSTSRVSTFNKVPGTFELKIKIPQEYDS